MFLNRWSKTEYEIAIIKILSINPKDTFVLQRAFIAMYLAQNMEVLLLDKPITYLDIYH